MTEDIKQAADYLSKTVEAPDEAQGVAIGLSQRVGSPKKPLSDAAAVSSALVKGNATYDKDLARLMKWLDNYEGAELEGTGLSVWGAGGGLVIIGIVVLCVLVPALIPLILQLVQIIAGTSRTVLKQTSASMVHAINEFKKDNPDAAKELTGILSKRMDSNSKTLIEKLKNGKI